MSGQPSTRGSIAGWQSLGNPGNGRECRVTWSNETTCRPVVVMPQGAGSTELGLPRSQIELDRGLLPRPAKQSGDPAQLVKTAAGSSCVARRNIVGLAGIGWMSCSPSR